MKAVDIPYGVSTAFYMWKMKKESKSMRMTKKRFFLAIPIILVLVMTLSMTVFAAEEAKPEMYATF